MTNKKLPFLGRVKLVWNSAMREVKKLLGQVQEKVDIDSHFARLAHKWDRINKGMVKLDPTFLGIFDKDAKTLTIREECSLEKGDLIESEHVQYRVEALQPGQTQISLEIEQVTHLVPCKVAVLAKI